MIELQGVHKRYPGESGDPVLAGIDLAVAPGQVVLISGTTGAGKTTLTKLIYAAELADQGTVVIFGRDVARLRRSSVALLRRMIGVVPQAFELFEDRTAAGNVALPLEIRAESPAFIRDRSAAALAALGLGRAAHVSVAKLSIGQRQRVAVARAVVGAPQIVIADEPSAYLDNDGRERFIALLCDLARRGGAAVVTSSDHKLLCAGAQYGWRHLELWGGLLRVVADRGANRVEAGDGPAGDDYESIEITRVVTSETHESIAGELAMGELYAGEIAAGEIAPQPAVNVVPFRRSASSGGLSE